MKNTESYVVDIIKSILEQEARFCVVFNLKAHCARYLNMFNDFGPRGSFNNFDRYITLEKVVKVRVGEEEHIIHIALLEMDIEKNNCTLPVITTVLDDKGEWIIEHPFNTAFYLNLDKEIFDTIKVTTHEVRSRWNREENYRLAAFANTALNSLDIATKVVKYINYLNTFKPTGPEIKIIDLNTLDLKNIATSAEVYGGYEEPDIKFRMVNETLDKIIKVNPTYIRYIKTNTLPNYQGSLYKSLEELALEYKDKGLDVFAYPLYIRRSEKHDYISGKDYNALSYAIHKQYVTEGGYPYIEEDKVKYLYNFDKDQKILIIPDRFSNYKGEYDRSKNINSCYTLKLWFIDTPNKVNRIIGAYGVAQIDKFLSFIKTATKEDGSISPLLFNYQFQLFGNTEINEKYRADLTLPALETIMEEREVNVSNIFPIGIKESDITHVWNNYAEDDPVYGISDFIDKYSNSHYREFDVKITKDYNSFLHEFTTHFVLRDKEFGSRLVFKNVEYLQYTKEGCRIKADVEFDYADKEDRLEAGNLIYGNYNVILSIDRKYTTQYSRNFIDKLFTISTFEKYPESHIEIMRQTAVAILKRMAVDLDLF